MRVISSHRLSVSTFRYHSSHAAARVDHHPQPISLTTNFTSHLHTEKIARAVVDRSALLHTEKAEALISLIKSTSTKSHLLQIHAHLICNSLFQHSIFFSPFLFRIALPPFRDLNYAKRVFSNFRKPDYFQYNVMIRAYGMSDSPEIGFQFYQEMLRFGVKPNSLTTSFVTSCCIKIWSLFGGLQIHARILRDGHQSDGRLLTTLMGFYSSKEKYSDACKLFDEMCKRDTIAWNVLISCYMRGKRTRDTLGVFDMMRSANDCRPDEVTCLMLLQACANLNALVFGEGVHRYCEEHGFDKAMNVRNALITMYSRCGCVEDAFEVFKGMAEKDVVSWTAMISGLASNGYGRDAIEAFREMQSAGVSPDDQTFTGVLSACSHSGLLDEGRMFFNSMSEEFGIPPNIHHYGCVVDLMGRAGMVNEAYNLINSMKVKPDATIWRTLLGACRIHRQADLGEQVIEHLIELKAQEAGDYVLLLNIYSSLGDWDKVMNVRKMMKDRGIQTNPACSTIEFRGEIHEFVANDSSHSRKTEIYEMLDEINQQLRMAGYVAEIVSELHNVGVEEKQIALSYHSEKLAIAFGVLSSPPGTSIRVAKDLRICVDCHNFAKMLSAVYNREVVIRDRNRFHHFREGRCSCNDYW
ncbi:Pentatricopeptide repeat-containing protein [Capsicum chinense]|nr:Pentatricopeptide repeat-containing protein [Capsicum chinense]